MGVELIYQAALRVFYTCNIALSSCIVQVGSDVCIIRPLISLFLED